MINKAFHWMHYNWVFLWVKHKSVLTLICVKPKPMTFIYECYRYFEYYWEFTRNYLAYLHKLETKLLQESCYIINKLNKKMCPWNTDAPVGRWMDEQTLGWMNGLTKEDHIILLMIILFMVICIKFHHYATSNWL